ncbi:hypothetical protein KM043_001542 [Ampulex compressa]|nr:hypothetical protein KM043_001542 [Ampulex compressa]
MRRNIERGSVFGYSHGRRGSKGKCEDVAAPFGSVIARYYAAAVLYALRLVRILSTILPRFQPKDGGGPLSSYFTFDHSYYFSSFAHRAPEIVLRTRRVQPRERRAMRFGERGRSKGRIRKVGGGSIEEADGRPLLRKAVTACSRRDATKGERKKQGAPTKAKVPKAFSRSPPPYDSVPSLRSIMENQRKNKR